ncbi:MAG: hypothetical protein ACQEVA_01995 [Myxococcota bacterium]
MFQIKTDIRQYNCETHEKVEKLIRNWVIRPSDLIYNEDKGEWNPIGQHPTFDELFRELEDEESRVPDTVVTSDRPSGDDEDGGEVTQITESPLEDEDEESDEQTPERPEPSDDVEGLIRDSDEITMMTDKTLDMMRTDGDDEAEGEKEEDTDVVDRDEVTEEEDTDVVGRDDVEGSPEEPTQLIDQNDVDGAPSDDGSTVVAEGDDGDDAGEGEETIVVDREATGEEESGEPEAGEGGRHGLPEDVFVTNEIPAQSAEDGVLDELGELGVDDEEFDLDEGLDEGSEEVTDETEAPESGERRAKWRIVMSEDEDDVDSEWENVAKEMRDTDEFTQEELETKVSEDRSAPQEDLDFQDEDAAEEDAAEVDEPRGDESSEQDEEDLEEVAVEGIERGEDDDDLDGLLDDAAELVGVNVHDAEAQSGDREPRETPVGQTVTDPAFVSEGYKMELPIDVGPSEEDLAVGVPKANVSESVKESTFPYPKPKHPGRVIIRTFGIGEELADEDDLADDLPDVGDPDVDPHAETKPVDGGENKVKSDSSGRAVRTPARSAGGASSAENESPRDQSALIVIALLGTFIIALLLAVYFLG